MKVHLEFDLKDIYDLGDALSGAEGVLNRARESLSILTDPQRQRLADKAWAYRELKASIFKQYEAQSKRRKVTR